MLRKCVMENPSKWEDYLHLVEFDYSNGYQSSLKMGNGRVVDKGNGWLDSKDQEKFKGSTW